MISYTETKVNRDAVTSGMTGLTGADKKTSIFQTANKVSVVESVLLTGTPRNHPTKRYYRWFTYTSTGFFRTSSGLLQPYEAYRSPGGRVHEPWRMKYPKRVMDLLEADTDLGNAFRHSIWEEFNVTRLSNIYPMLDKYTLPQNYSLIPCNLKRAFRDDNWGEYTRRIFGKTRHTARLEAAVANTEPYVVSMAHQYRGLIPDDALLKFIENNHFDDEIEENFKPHDPMIRKHVSRLTPEARLILAGRTLDMSDIIRVNVLARKSAPVWYLPKEGSTQDSWSAMFEEVYGAAANTPEKLAARNLPTPF